MHELAIACNLVEAATASAEAAGAQQVVAIHMRLGALSGVVKDALLFGYDVAARGTLIEGAVLVVEEVPGRVHCGACGQTSALESAQLLRCPLCGALPLEIVAGRELELVSLEVEV